jgi:hypothetical protein
MLKSYSQKKKKNGLRAGSCERMIIHVPCHASLPPPPPPAVKTPSSVLYLYGPVEAWSTRSYHFPHNIDGSQKKHKYSVVGMDGDENDKTNPSDKL